MAYHAKYAAGTVTPAYNLCFSSTESKKKIGEFCVIIETWGMIPGLKKELEAQQNSADMGWKVLNWLFFFFFLAVVRSLLITCCTLYAWLLVQLIL
jgi:hypothetical protein